MDYGVSSRKLPPTVPKTNSKWDGMPHIAKEKSRQSRERKDSIWSAIVRRPSHAVSRSSFGTTKTVAFNNNAAPQSGTFSSQDKHISGNSMPNRPVSPVQENESLPLIPPLTSLADDLLLPSPTAADMGLSDGDYTAFRSPASPPDGRSSAGSDTMEFLSRPTLKATSQSEPAGLVKLQMQGLGETHRDSMSPTPLDTRSLHERSMLATHPKTRLHQPASPCGSAPSRPAAGSDELLNLSSNVIDHDMSEGTSEGSSLDQSSMSQGSSTGTALRVDRPVLGSKQNSSASRPTSHSRSSSTSSFYIAPAKVSEQYIRALHSSHSHTQPRQHSHSRSSSRSLTSSSWSMKDPFNTEQQQTSTYSSHSRQQSNDTVASTTLSLLPGESSPRLMQASVVSVLPASITSVKYLPPPRHSRVNPRSHPGPLQVETPSGGAKNFSKPFSSYSSPAPNSAPPEIRRFPSVQYPKQPRRSFHRHNSSAELRELYREDREGDPVTETAKEYALSVGFWETAMAASAGTSVPRGRLMSDPGPIAMPRPGANDIGIHNDEDEDVVPFSSRLDGPFDPSSTLF